MTFMASLAANPTGSSGVYGQPSGQPQQDILGIVNQLKDREMRDFQTKAGFMADLSLKQDRMRQMFNPEDPNNYLGPSATNRQGIQNTQGMNTVISHDPNQITGAQKAELGIRQQQANTQQGELGVRQAQVAQAGKMGEERIANQTKQEQLNQQKSDQIHQQKVNELSAKQDEYKQKMELAQQQLADKNTSAEKQLELHKTMNDNMKAFHEAEMSRKQLEFDKTSAQHEETIKRQAEELKQRSREHKVQKDAQGNEITTDIQRGDTSQAENDPLGIR